MLVVGHRSARNQALENTIPGFRHAVELGLQGVEFDLRLDRDGTFLVIHNATVDRTKDGSGKIGDFTSSELAAMDARAGHSDWSVPCGVPTLAQVLDVVGHLPRLMIEIKADGEQELARVARGVIDEITARSLEPQATVTSFEPAALEIVRRIAPNQSFGYIGRGDSFTFLDDARRLGCDQVDVNLAKSSPDIFVAARASGLRTITWPCNSADDLAEAQRRGADMVTTDEPSLILGLLRT